MRKGIVTILMILLLSSTVWALEGREPKANLSQFDGAEWSAMTIESKRLIPLLASGKAVLVDIRFSDQTAFRRFDFALMIPLDELPERLHELPRDKIIVLACPHMDRAMIAVTYLKAEGFNALYLSDGLIGLARNLRGERSAEQGNRSEKSRQLPKR